MCLRSVVSDVVIGCMLITATFTRVCVAHEISDNMSVTNANVVAEVIYRKFVLSDEKSVLVFREINREKNVSKLKIYMKDSDPYVLRHVVFRLGELDSDESRKYLRELWQRIRTPTAQLSNQALADPIYKAALYHQVLRIFGGDSIHIDLLIPLIENTSLAVRADTAKSLGLINNPRSVIYLCELLSDDEYHVALKAIQSFESMEVDDVKRGYLIKYLKVLTLTRKPAFPDISHRLQNLLERLPKNIAD